jgi:hypothetical protein
MNLLLGLQEYISSIDSKKRIELLRYYVNPKSSDVILDIGGNTSKYQQQLIHKIIVKRLTFCVAKAKRLHSRFSVLFYANNNDLHLQW